MLLTLCAWLISSIALGVAADRIDRGSSRTLNLAICVALLACVASALTLLGGIYGW